MISVGIDISKGKKYGLYAQATPEMAHEIGVRLAEKLWGDART